MFGPLPATHVELRRIILLVSTLTGVAHSASLYFGSVRFGSLRFASVHRSFVLFWPTVAGRKLLLDGKRGPAIEGGSEPILESPLSSCVTLLVG